MVSVPEPRCRCCHSRCRRRHVERQFDPIRDPRSSRSIGTAYRVTPRDCRDTTCSRGRHSASLPAAHRLAVARAQCRLRACARRRTSEVTPMSAGPIASASPPRPHPRHLRLARHGRPPADARRRRRDRLPRARPRTTTHGAAAPTIEQLLQATDEDAAQHPWPRPRSPRHRRAPGTAGSRSLSCRATPAARPVCPAIATASTATATPPPFVERFAAGCAEERRGRLQ